MVSIILPVYNTAAYLEECLQSIAAQTYADYEVLAVDDGSTDESRTILEHWAEKDDRIKVFSQQNQGVSAARNVGLDHAQGEYVCFVDADDLLEPDYLSALLEAMGEEVDSAMGGFATFGLKDKPGVTVVPEVKKVETLEENLLEFYDYQQPQWQHYLWNRMFRRSVIVRQGLRFDESIYYKEDGLFLVQYLCRSNGSVGCTDRVVYRYRRTLNGAIGRVKTNFDKKLVTNLKSHQLIIQELRANHVGGQILELALSQAKSTANWIQLLNIKPRVSSFSSLLVVEKLMLQILGIRKYLSWRLRNTK